MRISAIQPFTVLDYPQKLACIVFLAGCDFRCGFCHNAQFVLPEEIRKLKDHFIPQEAIFNFLKQRKHSLDAVVISGGEPTMHAQLPSFIQRIKEMGFLVKLDTNGHHPFRLSQYFKQRLIDYVAMDIKSDLTNYSKIVSSCVTVSHIEESIRLIKESGIAYEFRTTIVKEIHTVDLLQEMIPLVKDASLYALQAFRPQRTLEKRFALYHGPNEDELCDMKKIFEPYVKRVEIRI